MDAIEDFIDGNDGDDGETIGDGRYPETYVLAGIIRAVGEDRSDAPIGRDRLSLFYAGALSRRSSDRCAKKGVAVCGKFLSRYLLSVTDLSLAPGESAPKRTES